MSCAMMATCTRLTLMMFECASDSPERHESCAVVGGEQTIAARASILRSNGFRGLWAMLVPERSYWLVVRLFGALWGI